MKVRCPVQYDSAGMDRIIRVANKTFAAECVTLRTGQRCLVEIFIPHRLEFLLLDIAKMEIEPTFVWDVQFFRNIKAPDIPCLPQEIFL